jgi:hypothetical protein
MHSHPILIFIIFLEPIFIISNFINLGIFIYNYKDYVGVDCNVSPTLLRKEKKDQENYSEEVSHRLRSEEWRSSMLYIETLIFLFQHTKQ